MKGALMKLGQMASYLDDGLPASILGYPQATIDSTCNSKTVILVAPDVKEELPVLYVRLRDAVTKRGLKVIEIASHDTGFTKYAWRSVRCEPRKPAAPVTTDTGWERRAVLAFSLVFMVRLQRVWAGRLEPDRG